MPISYKWISASPCSQELLLKRAKGGLTASIPLFEKYPVPPAIMQPTRSPITTLVDFIIGLPNLSHRMIVRKTENPSPINSADPQGKACGASLLGQSIVVGNLEHSPLPPAQFLKPLPMSFTPISMTVGPVTIGGKIRWRMRGGTNERPISRRAQRHDVPNKLLEYRYFYGDEVQEDHKPISAP